MAKQDPAVIAAQNRHKIEKDKRRKHYHDLQVQGTNNSSIVSKRSVEKIYNPIMEPESKEWFKHFVPKAKRRSPAINRGYWIRMESIKQMIFRILEQYSHVRVINLGCGFDPLPFQLLAEKNEKFEFFDFDYPELVQRKMGMIKESPEIIDVIGELLDVPDMEDLGVFMATKSYKLIGCDLKNTTKYKQQITQLSKGDGASIFIAEVSLAYMKPEHANPVVEILSELPNSHFLVLEQIMPSGEDHFFAQKMLYHFDHLRSPLQCVQEYSTKVKQRKRFQQYYPNVTVVDMFESWQQLVLEEKKKMIDRVEHFDEWEEFIVFCQHYVVIHATNSKKTILVESTDDIIENLGLESTPQFSMTLLENEKPLELKFPAACASSNGVHVHGGMWQTRNDDLLRLQEAEFSPIEVEERPQARMCHTLTSLQDGRLLLMGGRTRPGTVLDDVWILNENEQLWTQLSTLDDLDLTRHSAVALSPGCVLLFSNGRFVLLTVDAHNTLTTSILVTTDVVPNVKSCGLSYDPETKTGYIVGGVSNAIAPSINDTIFKFSVDLDTKTISLKTVCNSKQTARIGCVTHITNGKLYIIGGVGQTLSDQNTTVLVMNTLSKKIQGVRISDEIWKTYPALVGFQLAGSTLVGGGAVCYSFGSVYNPTYHVEFN